MANPTPDAPGLPELPDRDVDTERGDFYSMDAMEAYGRACYEAALSARPLPSDWVADCEAPFGHAMYNSKGACVGFRQNTGFGYNFTVADFLRADKIMPHGAPHTGRLVYAAPSAPAEAESCTGCSGNGEIGGLTPTGYESDTCPHCKGSGQETAPEPLAQGGACSVSHSEYVSARGQWRMTVWADDEVQAGTKLYASPQPAALWCMHILGPDDVHPAPSKAHAEQAAERLNAFMASRTDRHPLDPECRAIVALWPHSPESHAESVGKFIDEWLTPNPTQPSASVGECPACKGVGEVMLPVWTPDPQDGYDALGTCPKCGGSGSAFPKALQDLLYFTEHCLSAADEDVDYGTSREWLDAMTTMGIMEKTGRGKWAPSDQARPVAEALSAIESALTTAAGGGGEVGNG